MNHWSSIGPTSFRKKKVNSYQLPLSGVSIEKTWNNYTILYHGQIWVDYNVRSAGDLLLDTKYT